MWYMTSHVISDQRQRTLASKLLLSTFRDLNMHPVFSVEYTHKTSHEVIRNIARFQRLSLAVDQSLLFIHRALFSTIIIRKFRLYQIYQSLYNRSSAERVIELRTDGANGSQLRSCSAQHVCISIDSV